MRSLVIATLLAACAGPTARGPTSRTVWGQPSRTMALGVEVDGEIVTVFIANRGSKSQRVIATGVKLEIERAGWRGEVYDRSGATHLNRDSSFALIQPDDQLAIPIDLGSEARRSVGVDGGRAIDPGTYSVTASYNAMTAAAGDWWTGALEAGPVTVAIE